MKIGTKKLLTLIVLLVFAGFATGQQADPVGLTDFPVPAWPEGGIDPEPGVMPPEFSETYVFVDLANNEFVVAYPIALEEAEEEEEQEQAQQQQQQQGQQARGRGRGRGGQQPATQGRGRGGRGGRGGQQQPEEAEEPEEEPEDTGPVPLKITHYDLLRAVEPAVTLDVSEIGADRYRYAYTLANGPGAKQSIDQWAMVMPPAAAGDAIKHPEGWFGIVQPERTYKLKNPEWIPNGAGAVWSFQNPENVIKPGAVATGFELESELRPGFTVGFFREAESTGVKVATSGYVPDVVKEQMDRLLILEYNSKTVLTIGPKFDSNVATDAIAQDFVQGIFTLSRMGVLDLGSEFVRTTLNELTGIGPGTDGSSIRLTASASSRVETEILNALKVSLGTD